MIGTFSDPKTSSEHFGSNAGASFSNTPSAVSSTTRRVPACHWRLWRTDSGRVTRPSVEILIVSFSAEAI